MERCGQATWQGGKTRQDGFLAPCQPRTPWGGSTSAIAGKVARLSAQTLYKKEEILENGISLKSLLFLLI
jgi:hypothetical protein